MANAKGAKGGRPATGKRVKGTFLIGDIGGTRTRLALHGEERGARRCLELGCS